VADAGAGAAWGEGGGGPEEFGVEGGEHFGWFGEGLDGCWSSMVLI
jgi:hypothetical protein